jgi:hypothetical protein
MKPCGDEQSRPRGVLQRQFGGRAADEHRNPAAMISLFGAGVTSDLRRQHRTSSGEEIGSTSRNL